MCGQVLRIEESDKGIYEILGQKVMRDERIDFPCEVIELHTNVNNSFNIQNIPINSAVLASLNSRSKSLRK